MTNDLTLLIIADKNNARNISLLIESIRAFNDVSPSVTVLFDNDAGPELREWGSAQEDIIFVYSDEGEIPYGKAVMDVVRELPVTGNLLIVPGTHMLIPGTLSGMMGILESRDYQAIVGANYMNSRYYGLGRDFLIHDYEQLVEYSVECGYEPYVTERLDPGGSILIGRVLLDLIAGYKELDKFNEENFKTVICSLAKACELEVVADRGDFWGDNRPSSMESVHGEETILSICVPTYNRGEKAYALGCYLLEERKKYGLEKEVEIFFSDNGSDLECDKYDALRLIADENDNFVYVRNDENIGFEGNMRTVLSGSKGRFALIVSDEDRILFPGLKIYLMYLKQHSEIAVMKGHTNKTYFAIEPLYTEKGPEALEAFYLRGNYISGVIYNKDVLTEEIIKEMHDSFSNGNRAYYWYPHLFWDAYCLLNGSFASGDIPLILEGETGYSIAIVKDSKILKYGYPEERISQGVGFTTQIGLLNPDNDEIAKKMYLMAFQKTVTLLLMKKRDYLDENMDWNQIIDQMADRFIESYTGEGFTDKEKCYETIKYYIEYQRSAYKQ